MTKTQTIRVEIRTGDPTFTEQGREGRKVTTATETGRQVIKTTGREMVTFTMPKRPADWPMAHGFAPVEWIVS